MEFTNAQRELGLPLARVSVLARTETPTLVCPTPAFAAIAFGMYTAANKCIGK